ncbi:MAG: sugar ABC transporter permease [Anaerolineaceae bacterium]|nr:sugar ABC transporter permease [Anaerolineaceae bacterium]
MAQDTAQPNSIDRRQPTSTRGRGFSGMQIRQAKSFSRAMIFLAPSLAIFITFIFIPLIRTIWLSSYLTNPLGKPMKYIGLEQYQRLFSTPEFGNSLVRSILFVLETVPTTILVALILAVLANQRLKGISIFRVIFSITIAVSSATASLMFLYLYHPSIGSLNYFIELLGGNAIPWLTSDKTALTAISLTTVWLQLGLNTVILLAAMQGIPEELYESAMIDGANGWDRFWGITLPFLSSSFFFLLVVDMLAAFQTFTPVQIMTSGGPVNSTNLLVYSIYRQFYFNGQYGLAAAQSIMLFIIMLLLTVFQFIFVEKKVFYE